MAEHAPHPDLLIRLAEGQAEVKASGRVPICRPCHRGRPHQNWDPIRVIPFRAEVCHFCDRLTTGGLYARVKS